jgi:hypothetical protein
MINSKILADILEFWSPFQFLPPAKPLPKKYPKDFTKHLADLQDGSLKHEEGL